MATTGARSRIVLLLGLCTCAATASGQEGLYVGGAIGGRGYDNACQPEAISCDRRDDAWGAFAGYRFNRRFGIELGYIDLGGARATYPRVTRDLEVRGDIEGYDASVLFGIPAGDNVEFYVRAGGFRWQAKTHSDEFATEDEGWSATAGAGFDWRVGRSWQFRGQYLYLDDIGGEATGRANGHFVSFGVSYFLWKRQ